MSSGNAPRRAHATALRQSLLFLNGISPVRDVFLIHLNTLFQTCISKSPLLYIHQILLPRKQRTTAESFWSGSPRFVPKLCNQILHDHRWDSRPFPGINVAEQDQMAEQYAPINRFRVTAVFHGHAHNGVTDGKTSTEI